MGRPRNSNALMSNEGCPASATLLTSLHWGGAHNQPRRHTPGACCSATVVVRT